MARRPLTPKDVVSIAHKHFQEKNRYLGSNLVLYVLETCSGMSDDAAIARMNAVGYGDHSVGKDAVKCARNCIKFAEALVQQGYAWDDWNGKLALPVPKEV